MECTVQNMAEQGAMLEMCSHRLEQLWSRVLTSPGISGAQRRALAMLCIERLEAVDERSEERLKTIATALDAAASGPPGTADSIRRAFHQLYYDSGTWLRTFWLGHHVLKCPFDLWTYQEILAEVRPELIIECGTKVGGSALFFASVCDLLDHGRVVTVDVKSYEGQPQHPRIRYLVGSSTAPEIVAQVHSAAAGARSVMVVLDSDHRAEHVLRELYLYSPLVTAGNYLVVEDSNVNGHPVYPEHGPGPMEALERFIAESDAFVIDREREKFHLSFNPRGYLRRRDDRARLDAQ